MTAASIGPIQPRRAGIAGFSYAAGPSILAALEPDIRDRARFVLSVGGYHDLRRVAAVLITGCFQDRARSANETRCCTAGATT